MPLVDNGDGVHIEYELPEWVRDKISVDFAVLFIAEARRLFNTRDTTLLYSDQKEPTHLLSLFTVDNVGLEIYSELTDESEIDELISTMIMNTSAGGFNKAFEYACDGLGLQDVKKESPGDWYDYDFFIDDITHRCGEMYFGEVYYNTKADAFITEWNREAEEEEEYLWKYPE